MTEFSPEKFPRGQTHALPVTAEIIIAFLHEMPPIGKEEYPELEKRLSGLERPLAHLIKELYQAQNLKEQRGFFRGALSMVALSEFITNRAELEAAFANLQTIDDDDVVIQLPSAAPDDGQSFGPPFRAPTDPEPRPEA